MHRVHDLTKACLDHVFLLLQPQALDDVAKRPPQRRRLRRGARAPRPQGRLQRRARPQIKYAMVALLDEVAQAQPGRVAEYWEHHLLQRDYFNEVRAGEGFFGHLERLLEAKRDDQAPRRPAGLRDLPLPRLPRQVRRPRRRQGLRHRDAPGRRPHQGAHRRRRGAAADQARRLAACRAADAAAPVARRAGPAVLRRAACAAIAARWRTTPSASPTASTTEGRSMKLLIGASCFGRGALSWPARLAAQVRHLRGARAMLIVYMVSAPVDPAR
jgi:hypothetical protein